MPAQTMMHMYNRQRLRVGRVHWETGPGVPHCGAGVRSGGIRLWVRWSVARRCQSTLREGLGGLRGRRPLWGDGPGVSRGLGDDPVFLVLRQRQSVGLGWHGARPGGLGWLVDCFGLGGGDFAAQGCVCGLGSGCDDL